MYISISLSLCIYIYIYMSIYTHIHVIYNIQPQVVTEPDSYRITEREAALLSLLLLLL